MAPRLDLAPPLDYEISNSRILLDVLLEQYLIILLYSFRRATQPVNPLRLRQGRAIPQRESSHAPTETINPNHWS